MSYVQARHDSWRGALGSFLHWRQGQGPGLGHPGVDTPPQQQHREEEKRQNEVCYSAQLHSLMLKLVTIHKKWRKRKLSLVNLSLVKISLLLIELLEWK